MSAVVVGWITKGKPTARGVYQVAESRTEPDAAAPPAYAFWNSAGWSFTAPTIAGARKFAASRSKNQNRAWRPLP